MGAPKAHYLLLTLLLSVIQHTRAQDIISADGKNMGLRSAFMQACTSGNEEGILEIQGSRMSMLQLCGCMADSLIPRLTKAQIEYYFKENHHAEIFEKEEYAKIVIQCALGSFSYINMDQEIGNLDTVRVHLAIDSAAVLNSVVSLCEDNLRAITQLSELFEKGDRAHRQCECFSSAIIGKHFTYRDVYTFSGRRSDEVQSIRMNCLNWIWLGDSLGIQSGSPRLPLAGSSALKVLPLSANQEIEIRVGDTSRLVRIEPGMNELILDEATASYLTNIYVLNERNFAGEMNFLWKGSNVPARVYLLDAFRLDDYFFHDVPLVVIKGAEPTIGGGILNRFRYWKILDNQLKVFK